VNTNHVCGIQSITQKVIKVIDVDPDGQLSRDDRKRGQTKPVLPDLIA
jgi:hypothetical protein